MIDTTKLLTDTQRIDLLIATIRGIRDMAKIQADAGSPTWAKCVAFIDKVLEDVKK